MVIHMAVNPALEINQDGTQAKAVLAEPGDHQLPDKPRIKNGRRLVLGQI